MTITSGLKMFTKFARPTPSARADVADHHPRHLVAAERQLGDERAGQRAPVLERAPERRVRLARHAQRRLAHERGAGGDRLEAAQFGQLPWQGGPSMSTTMWPSSAAAPTQPR